MNEKVPVAVAYGDGIGPEIMHAVLEILEKAGAWLDLREVVVGERAYNAGEKAGISAQDMATLEQCRAMLKAPLATPQGGDYSSVNVAIRKHFDLFANVRPVVSYDPVLPSHIKKADLVIIRENIEGDYIGSENRLTPDTVVSRQIVTRSETDRINRFAYDYAIANGRGKITAMAKDNIKKFTDGLFHTVFDEIGNAYPSLVKNFNIIDFGMAWVAARPDTFDIVVTGNLYGDIMSDVAAQVTDQSV